MPDFFQIVRNPNCDTTDWDWAIDPTGMEYILRDLYNRYGKPLMITENCLVQNGTGCRLSERGAAVPQDAPCRKPSPTRICGTAHCRCPQPASAPRGS